MYGKLQAGIVISGQEYRRLLPLKVGQLIFALG